MKITAQQLRDIIKEELLRERQTLEDMAMKHSDTEFTVIQRMTTEGDDLDTIHIGLDRGHGAYSPEQWYWLVEDPMNLEKGSQLTGEQINNAIRTGAMRVLTDDELRMKGDASATRAMTDQARDMKAQTRESRQLSRRELKEAFRRDMLLTEGLLEPGENGRAGPEGSGLGGRLSVVELAEKDPSVDIEVEERTTAEHEERDMLTLVAMVGPSMLTRQMLMLNEEGDWKTGDTFTGRELTTWLRDNSVEEIPDDVAQHYGYPPYDL